jgi:hypothetical protein
VLHTFCSEQNCTDGLYPVGTLLADSDGGLYGVTIDGGEVKDHGGTVYQFKNQVYQGLIPLLHHTALQRRCYA